LPKKEEKKRTENDAVTFADLAAGHLRLAVILFSCTSSHNCFSCAALLLQVLLVRSPEPAATAAHGQRGDGSFISSALLADL